ncbi:hypothetical protein MAHJHV54_47570 [Mycobacterium avium subsp. hominissuis]
MFSHRAPTGKNRDHSGAGGVTVTPEWARCFAGGAAADSEAEEVEEVIRPCFRTAPRRQSTAPTPA